ncbi:MAG: hypothetical protein K2X80_19540 [Pseudomonadaceae bacterium]|nr:hypothetical protein [Pseudomonadaceae bacterium]
MSLHNIHHDTPEGMMAIAPGADAGLPIDAINAACVRARSVLLLLQSEFEEPDRCSSPATIMGALWAVEGMLDQIGKLAAHAYHSTHPSNANAQQKTGVCI